MCVCVCVCVWFTLSHVSHWWTLYVCFWCTLVLVNNLCVYFWFIVSCTGEHWVFLVYSCTGQHPVYGFLVYSVLHWCTACVVVCDLLVTANTLCVSGWLCVWHWWTPCESISGLLLHWWPPCMSIWSLLLRSGGIPMHMFLVYSAGENGMLVFWFTMCPIGEHIMWRILVYVLLVIIVNHH